MITEDEIESEIVQMGYILATPVRTSPSYYRLEDDTILRIFMRINYLLLGPKPDYFDVNSTNVISTFVPSQKRRPELHESNPHLDLKDSIIKDDMDFVVLKEDFSKYELTNGVILSLKVVLAQAKKTKFYTKEGEPVYVVNSQPVINFTKKS